MKYWIIAVVVLLGTACSDLNRVPSKYLSTKKMESVLWDMMLADRFVEQFVKADSSISIDGERFIRYEQVFAVHDIDYETFKESMEYYITRPDQLKGIYVELNKKREELRMLRDKEAQEKEEALLKEKDSLLNLQTDSLKMQTDSLDKLTDTLINKNEDSLSENKDDSGMIRKLLDTTKKSIRRNSTLKVDSLTKEIPVH